MFFTCSNVGKTRSRIMFSDMKKICELPNSVSTKFYWNTAPLFFFFSCICGCFHLTIARVELQQELYGMQGLMCLLFGPWQRKWPTPAQEHQLSVAQRHGHPPSLSLLLLSSLLLTSSWGTASLRSPECHHQRKLDNCVP